MPWNLAGVLNSPLPPTGVPGTKRYDPGESAYNVQPGSMRKFRAALAKALAGTGICEIGLIGPSTTVGIPGNPNGGSPAHFLAQTLKAQGLNAGYGWVPVVAQWSPTLLDSRWVLSANVTAYTSAQGAGYRNHIARSGTGAAGDTFTFTSTEAGTVVEWDLPGANGAYTYSIDGSAPVSVGAVSSPTSGHTLRTVTGLANTTHTLVITATTTTRVLVEKARVRNTTGIQVNNFGFSGSLSSDWDLTLDNDAADLFALSSSAYSGGSNPQNLIIFDATIWGNDYMIAGWSVAQTEAALNRIVQQWQARGADVLMLLSSAPSETVALGAYPIISAATYLAFRQAVYRVAETTNVTLVDAPDQHGDWATANTNGLMVDAVHLTAAGYASIGRILADTLDITAGVQPANVTALANLTGAADTTNYFTGLGRMATTAFSSLARTLLGRTTAAAMRTDLDVYSKGESAALNTGAEMGYAERVVNFATTNVTSGSTTLGSATTTVGAGGVIAGLSVTVVGEGKPVDIDFKALAQNTVASTRIGAYLLSDGQFANLPAGELAVIQSSAAAGTALTLRLSKRVVLTAGVSYTFTIGIYASAASTTTLISSANVPIVLQVTRR